MVFGTAVIRVEKSNDGKGSFEKSTEPSRDFNFVNKMKGFVMETCI